MKSIAIFASGNGSNCERIARYLAGSNKMKVSLVITNNASAKVVKRAERLGLHIEIMTKSDINDEKKLLPLLQSYSIDLIVLAGFMLFIPEYLIDAFPRKIINIHPSLLPKYGGKGMYGIHVHEAVKANNERSTGITIHYVSKEYDRGEIICQYETAISSEDTIEDIADKVHALEYAHYPKIIEDILSEELQ